MSTEIKVELVERNETNKCPTRVKFLKDGLPWNPVPILPGKSESFTMTPTDEKFFAINFWLEDKYRAPIKDVAAQTFEPDTDDPNAESKNVRFKGFDFATGITIIKSQDKVDFTIHSPDIESIENPEITQALAEVKFIAFQITVKATAGKALVTSIGPDQSLKLS